MNSEWNTLTPEQRTAVQAVIKEVRKTGERAAQKITGGDVYAYPHRDGIAWGVNAGRDGINSARGITK